MKSKRSNNIEQRSLNFIITGKSGVGKSSFLNYLIGKNHFATGDGSPVTQDYFTFASFIKDNIEYKLYDTKGVEPDTTEECKNVILSKIEEKDQSDNIYDWIHTVYYCFAAPGKRIEPFEISFLKEICQKTNIIILLTKKDLATETDLEKLAIQIHNEIGDAIPVIPVCSVKERTRKHISTPDGKEEVLKVSFYGLWNKLSKKLPKDLISNLFEPLGKINSNNVYDSKNILEWILKTLNPYPFDYDLFGLLSRSTKESEYSLTYFANFPENFHLEEKKHTENLKEFLNGTLNAYRILQIRCVSLRDNSLRECNVKMCSEILDFYKDINHCSPPQLHTLKTEEAYKEIYDSDFHKNALQTLQREINELTKACY